MRQEPADADLDTCGRLDPPPGRFGGTGTAERPGRTLLALALALALGLGEGAAAGVDSLPPPKSLLTPSTKPFQASTSGLPLPLEAADEGEAEEGDAEGDPEGAGWALPEAAPLWGAAACPVLLGDAFGVAAAEARGVGQGAADADSGW
jgi:hypothetical protein